MHPIVVLEEACDLMRRAGVRVALIGGHAVNLYARPRSTVDVDFLVDGNDARVLKSFLIEAGFDVLDWREDIASVVRGGQRIDLLFANRAFSRDFLASARADLGAPCPVASPEALIALKLQAFNNDHRRLQDLVDIRNLIDAQHASLDLDLLSAVFELFDQRGLYEELLGGEP